MRYFAKFHICTQPKNKAQVQALAFMKTFASILLNSDAALDKMIADMRTGIDLINRNNPRCGDISFSAHIKQDYRGNSLFVGEICSYSFYPVLSDFIVSEKEPEQKTEEKPTKSSEQFEL